MAGSTGCSAASTSIDGRRVWAIDSPFGMVIKINHIAIATNDMAQAERFWGGRLGVPRDKRRGVEDEKVEVS